jgi:CBS domain-containing protein
MSSKPTAVNPEATLKEALRLMEDRPSQISVLRVMEGSCCLGLIHLQEICSEKGV